MKKCFFLFLLLSFPHFSFSAEDVSPASHTAWNTLVGRHVHEGLVDYEGMKRDRALLDEYLAGLQNYPVDALSAESRENRIAFWINLYNASVIRTVLDHEGIKRFDDIPAVFEIKVIRAAGEFFSFADVREYVLREYFRDERILIALVTARMDSPPLFPEAFTGEKLEEQLNRAVRTFVEDPARNRIVPRKKEVLLSPLFRDFQNDFLLNFGVTGEKSKFSDSERAVISFLLEHIADPDQRLFLNEGRYKIRFLPENSALNDLHGLRNKAQVLE